MSVLLRCLLMGVYEILSLLLYDEDYRTFAFLLKQNKCNVAIPHGRKTNGRSGEQKLEDQAFLEA